MIQMRRAPNVGIGWQRSAATALALAGLLSSLAAAAESPPLDITGMTFVSSRDGANELVLRAVTARFKPDADVADLVQVDATVSAGADREAFEIRCDEGSLNLKNNNFSARGNVRGRTEDGREFESDWVEYDHAGGILFTDAPVLITEDGATLRGRGFRYYVSEQRFSLLGGATVVQQP